VVRIAFFAARDDAGRATSDLDASGLASQVRTLFGTAEHGNDVGVRRTTRAFAGAAIGAALGMATGGLACALFVGAAVVFPGVGAVLAGPLASALAGAGAGAALGLFLGTLVGRRLPRYEPLFFREARGALVAVQCSAEHAAVVEEILVSAGGAALCRR
jgi:hypothetical protein